MKKIACFWVICVVAVTGSGYAAPAPLKGYKTREVRLGKLHAIEERKHSETSDGGRHYGYVIEEQGKKRAVIDGIVGPAYDDIHAEIGEDAWRGPRFSPDGCHVAYPAKRGGKALLVIDGQETPTYDLVCPLSLSTNEQWLTYVGVRDKQFTLVMGRDKQWQLPATVRRSTSSRDGKRIAWEIQEGERCRLVVNGVPGPAYDRISSVVFSQDGKRLAYAARKAGKWQVVIDGKEALPLIAEPKFLLFLVFSPDGKRLVYTIIDGEHQHFAEGGAVGPAYNMVFGKRFSSDGKHVLYFAKSAEGECVVLDNIAGRTYPDIHGAYLSPDGKHIAYIAAKNEQQLMVVDGREGTGYERINSPKFSPDSQRVAYVAQTEGQAIVVEDGRGEGPVFEKIGYDTPVFSPDSRHMAYRAMRNGKWFVVLDGVVGPAWDSVPPYALKFASTSRRFAYVARRGKRSLVVADGKVLKTAERILSLRFTAKRDRLVYGLRDKGGYAIAVEAQVGPLYEWMSWYGSSQRNPPYIYPDGTLEYLAGRKGQLYRVKHTPTTPQTKK